MVIVTKSVLCMLPLSLGVDEGDHDVSRAPGGVEPLVIVSQSARVHEDPAHPGVHHLAVVTEEPTAAALQIFSNIKIFFKIINCFSPHSRRRLY